LGITVLGGCAEALPIGERSADGAWLSTVIHHIRDPTAAARELRRVLRPGAPAFPCRAGPGRLAAGPVVDALDVLVLR
jgi:ubiquinone/menaquinone biosynthesis C-methylase UbiE